jgi:hypothetical protein
VPDAGIPVAAIEYVRNQRDSSVYQYIMELRPDPQWDELGNAFVEPISESATTQQLLAENGLLRSTVAQLRDYSSKLKVKDDKEDDKAELNHQLAAQSEQLAAQSEQLAAKQRNLLQARDQIIGNAAYQGELDYRLGLARNENESLRQELNAVYRSRAWKLGRTILLPLRIVRRIIRKLK